MSELQNNTATPLTQQEQQLKTQTYIAYGLMLLGFFTGITWFAGVIWAYIQRSQAVNTVFQDHFSNIIKVFWVSILLGIIGLITFIVGIGYLVLIGSVIWSLYRLLKGVSRLVNNQPYHDIVQNIQS